MSQKGKVKMEIEVGEYVRTKSGKIDIFKEKDENYMFARCKNNTYWIFDIVKHSKSIIDLIKVGDIIEINKEKYEVIFDKSIDKLGILIPNRNCLEIRHSSLEYIFMEYEDIKILTKEQYMQSCYKVERKEEC